MKKSLTELREEMRAVARGERVPASLSTDIIIKVLAVPENRTLLNLISTNNPASVSELAKQADREQSNVSRALQRLVSIGFVRLEKTGKTVRPIAVKTGFRMDFTNNTYESLAVA